MKRLQHLGNFFFHIHSLLCYGKCRKYRNTSGVILLLWKHIHNGDVCLSRICSPACRPILADILGATRENTRHATRRHGTGQSLIPTKGSLRSFATIFLLLLPFPLAPVSRVGPYGFDSPQVFPPRVSPSRGP